MNGIKWYLLGNLGKGYMGVLCSILGTFLCLNEVKIKS